MRKAPRPYLQVYFSCCKVYQRIYRDAAGKKYAGFCPKCLRAIQFPIGPKGTSSRSFIAF